MKKLDQLAQLGQSIWYDYIQRSLLDERKFDELIKNGLRGVTSNPSIFNKAISTSTDYDDILKELNYSISDVNEIYETIVFEDISRTADTFLPVFKSSDGLDGYVSIEVNPILAYNSKDTVEEAIRIFNQLKKPNIMIKVPATDQGLPAMTELLSLGINVNATLIFNVSQYLKVAEAFISGLEDFYAAKGDLKKVSSVASFFVSRVDTAVDKKLLEKGNNSLLGKIAIANCKVAYDEAKRIKSTPRWKRLEKEGAQIQRLLWASTGTKNPKYSDTLYVDELIGQNTVNTMPPETLDAFLDHGIIETRIDKNVQEAYENIGQLKKMGIDLDSITQQLQIEGVNQFEEAFTALMRTIEEKRSSF